MTKEDFLNLSDMEQCKALLEISNKALSFLLDNQKILDISTLALKKANDFVENDQSIPAKEVSIFLNNPNESEDLGLLFYEANSLPEEQVIDIIALSVGFIAHVAHTLQNSKKEMSAPVVEANSDVVYEAFTIFEHLKQYLNLHHK